MLGRSSDPSLDAARYGLDLERAARVAAAAGRVVCAQCGHSTVRRLAIEVDGEIACSRRCEFLIRKDNGSHAKA